MSSTDDILVDNEERAIILNQYWPYGMNLKDQSVKEDRSLLYLYTINISQECTHDINGGCDYKAETELIKLYYISGKWRSKFVLLEHLDEEFSEYMTNADLNSKELNIQGVFLAHKTCPLKRNCYSGAMAKPSECLKFFGNENGISVYLEVNAYLLINISDKYLGNLFDDLKTKYFAGEFDYLEPKKVGLSNTLNFPEAEIPEGFKLKLFDFQLRSISWMKSIESDQVSDLTTISHIITSDDFYQRVKFKLGDSPYYLERSGKVSITESLKPTQTDLEPLRFYGGILADESGSGKTVTSLGLIHSSSFNESEQIKRIRRFGNLHEYMQSKATLIICPDVLYKQWHDEARRCNPNFKIVSLFGPSDTANYCWKDLAEADIIIGAHKYLNDYKLSSFEKNTKIVWEEVSEFKGPNDLQKIHFHRIIFDELSVIIERGRSECDAYTKLKADYFWGLTCKFEPNSANSLKSPLKLLQAPKRLQEMCDSNKMTQREVIRKHIVRNFHNFKLPDVGEEIILINCKSEEEISPNVFFLAPIVQATSFQAQIVQATRFQSYVVDNVLSLSETYEAVLQEGKDEIKKLQNEAARLEALLQDVLATTVKYVKSDLIIEYENVKIKIEKAQKDLVHFLKALDSYRKSEDFNECSLCCRAVYKSDLSYISLHHLLCQKCKHAFQVRYPDICNIGKICRAKHTYYDFFKVRIETDCKTQVLHQYITNLLKSDENARIILCYQYNDFNSLIRDSLTRFNVKFVELSSLFKCAENVELFRKSKETRLLIANMSEKCNGINLIEATHVILLHPFCTSDGKHNVDLERDALELAHRFGLNHSLKLVRFAVADTIEEKLLRRDETNLGN